MLWTRPPIGAGSFSCSSWVFGEPYSVAGIRLVEVQPRREYSSNARRRHASLDSSKLVSEHKGELSAALTQLVAALERVSLDGLQPGDRALLEQALLAARAALDRATSRDEPFPEED